MPQTSHGADLRKARHSQPGQIYLVATVTLNRQPIFATFSAGRTLIQTLRSEAALRRAETPAFVVLPDHLHWLLSLGDSVDLSSVVRSVKSVSAHRLGGGIWQKGFHDRALRREENLQDAARHVIANPVRAGLVKRLGGYPHWDAVWL